MTSRARVFRAAWRTIEALEPRRLLASSFTDAQLDAMWENASLAFDQAVAVLEYQNPQFESRLDDSLEMRGLPLIAPQAPTDSSSASADLSPASSTLDSSLLRAALRYPKNHVKHHIGKPLRPAHPKPKPKPRHHRHGSAATGGDPTAISSQTLGTLRNNFSGWVGFEFTTGPAALSVSQLGRWVVSGNTGTHTLKLVDAATGTDVPGGSVSVNTSGATTGQYLYGNLSSPVLLQPSHSYYLMSQETSGGDQWYDDNTTLTSTSDLTVNNSEWYDTAYHTNAGGAHSYGPVNFNYSLAPAVISTSFLTNTLPQQVIVSFNENVSASSWASAVTVLNLNTGTSVTPSSATYSSSTDAVTYGFSSTSSLSDGNYAAILSGSQITDSSGNHLIGSDNVPGHDYFANFFFKLADLNADRTVNFSDLTILSQHYGSAGNYSQGDVDYNGTVNFTDLTLLSQRYNTGLPLLGSAGTPSGVAVSPDRIHLSWPAATDTNVGGYDVYRYSTGAPQLIASNILGTDFLDTGLSAATNYTYFIVSTDSSGDTSYPTLELFDGTSAAGAISINPIADPIVTDSNTNVSFTTSFADSGSITTHTASVNWGDGNTTTATVSESNNVGTLTASHSYAVAGNYFGSMTVLDSTASTTELFGVGVFFDSDSGGYTLGQAYTLTPTFSDPAGGAGPSSYVVSWGDGSSPQSYASSAADFTDTYSSDANAPFTASVTATIGGQPYVDALEVDEAGPTLSLSGATSTTEGNTYSLFPNVYDGDSGDGLTYDISWGDGSADQTLTTSANSLTDVYTEPGTYTIEASVSDNDAAGLGQGDFGTWTVSVVEATPTYSLSWGGGSVNEGADATFTDTYSDPATHTLDNLTVDWGMAGQMPITATPATRTTPTPRPAPTPLPRSSPMMRGITPPAPPPSSTTRLPPSP